MGWVYACSYSQKTKRKDGQKSHYRHWVRSESCFYTISVLQRPYMSLIYDSGSRPYHCKISKIHVSRWGNFTVRKNQASARHRIQQVSSEINTWKCTVTQEKCILLRDICPSLSFFFFSFFWTSCKDDHLNTYLFLNMQKTWQLNYSLYGLIKKRIYLVRHMKQQKHPSKPPPSHWH